MMSCIETFDCAAWSVALASKVPSAVKSMIYKLSNDVMIERAFT